MKKIIKRAFTLIELLVVIAIIGILSGLIVVTMSGVTAKATIAKGQVFSNSLRSSLMANLVSDWNFDGSGVSDGSSATSSYLLDMWGQQSGTVTAAPPTVLSGSNCIFGSCLSFNGATQYVSIPHNPVFNFGTQMTAMVWVKGGAQSSGKFFFSQWDQSAGAASWGLESYWTSPYNKLVLYLSDNGAYASGRRKAWYTNDIVFDNNWHLLGFTWNSGIAKIYVDGAEDTNLTKYYDDAITTIHSSTIPLTIGCYLNNGSPIGYFAGQIDEARLYNAAISTSQIKEQYYAGLNGLLSSGAIGLEEYRERIDSLAGI